MSLLRAVLQLLDNKPFEGFILRDPFGITLASAKGFATQGVMFTVARSGEAWDVVQSPSGVRYDLEPFEVFAGEQVLFTLDLEVESS